MHPKVPPYKYTVRRKRTFGAHAKFWTSVPPCFGLKQISEVSSVVSGEKKKRANMIRRKRTQRWGCRDEWVATERLSRPWWSPALKWKETSLVFEACSSLIRKPLVSNVNQLSGGCKETDPDTTLQNPIHTWPLSRVVLYQALMRHGVVNFSHYGPTSAWRR